MPPDYNDDSPSEYIYPRVDVIQSVYSFHCEITLIFHFSVEEEESTVFFY